MKSTGRGKKARRRTLRLPRPKPLLVKDMPAILRLVVRREMTGDEILGIGGGRVEGEIKVKAIATRAMSPLRHVADDKFMI